MARCRTLCSAARRGWLPAARPDRELESAHEREELPEWLDFPPAPSPPAKHSRACDRLTCMKPMRRQAMHATIAVISAGPSGDAHSQNSAQPSDPGVAKVEVAGQAGILRASFYLQQRTGCCLACHHALRSPTSALCGRGAFLVLKWLHTACPASYSMERDSCGISSP